MSEDETVVIKDDAVLEHWIVLSMLADRGFFEKASRVVCRLESGADFNDFQNKDMEKLFKAARVYHETLQLQGFGAGISWAIFEKALQCLASSGDMVVLSEVQGLMQMAYQLTTTYTPGIPSATLQALPEWLGKNRIRYIKNLHESGSLTVEEYESFLAAELAFSRSVIRTKKASAGLETFEAGLAYTEDNTGRFFYGLRDVDRKMGGVKKGEASLIVAPSGAGKTVWSTMTCGNFIINEGKKVLIINTERSQGVHEVTRRLVAQRCKVPYKLVKDGVDVNSMTPQQRELFDKLRDSMSTKNFQFVMWDSAKNKSIRQGLLDIVHRAQDTMGGLDAINFDWIGGALGEGMTNDPGMLRLTYQNSADYLCGLAVDESVYVQVFAQAHASFVGKSWIDAMAIAECKSLHREMTNGIGLTALLADAASDGSRGGYASTQHASLFKVRKGEADSVKLVRRFEYMRFDSLSFENQQ